MANAPLPSEQLFPKSFYTRQWIAGVSLSDGQTVFENTPTTYFEAEAQADAMYAQFIGNGQSVNGRGVIKTPNQG